MFYGQGAGGAPTASAVLGDLVAVARNRVVGGRGPRESAYASLPVRPMGSVPTRYHVSLDVADRAGVLATISGAFAAQGVSIAAVRQTRRRATGRRAARRRLVVVTHVAPEAALAATVDELAGLDDRERAWRACCGSRSSGGRGWPDDHRTRRARGRV